MSIVFATTYPQRTSALILYGAFAREAWAPDNPWGGTTLEWTTSSPPIEHNFEDQPVLQKAPYDYRPEPVAK